MTRALVLAAAVSTGFAAAQNLSVGIKGGFTTDSIGSRFTNPESKPYSIGPSVEFKLPFDLFAEASALYSRVGQHYSFTTLRPGGSDTVTYDSRFRANSWEFPIVIRKYLDDRWGGRPFIGGGYALRAVSFTDYSYTYLSDEGLPQVVRLRSYHPNDNPSHGYVAAVGFERSTWRSRFVFVPEVRYTRWLTTPDGASGLWRQDRIQLMLGIKFR